MQQVAEENGLDVVNKLAENPVGSKLPSAEETQRTEQEEKLSRRYSSHTTINVCYMPAL